MLVADELRLSRLREAVQLGIDDFAVGRFKSFETVEALGMHLKQLADEVLGMDLQRHQLFTGAE